MAIRDIIIRHLAPFVGTVGEATILALEAELLECIEGMAAIAINGIKAEIGGFRRAREDGPTMSARHEEEHKEFPTHAEFAAAEKEKG